MSPGEIAALTTAALAVLGILAVLIRVAVKIDRVERMAQELKPNGGGSIKDAVHRIDHAVQQHSETLSEHEKRLSNHEGRIEALAMVASPTTAVVATPVTE